MINESLNVFLINKSSKSGVFYTPSLRSHTGHVSMLRRHAWLTAPIHDWVSLSRLER